MKKAGIVHRPGLANEMLEEMAPLLAEQGIDLSDPDAEVDPDRLNAALSYATERYNMETVQWAEAAHRAGFDGAAWMSNRRNDTAAVVLFGDRVEADGLSADSSVARIFSRQTDRDWLTDMCFPLGIHVGWKPPRPKTDP